MKDEGTTKEQLIDELTELRKRIARLEPAERRHADVKDTQGMEYLSRTATEFVELPSEVNIYRFIGERLQELVGNAVVVINSFDKVSDSLCTRALVGIGKHTKGVLELIGRDPLGMTYPITDAEGRRALLGGKLVDGPKGLHELSFGKIPESSCRAIEELLGLGNIYAIGFTWKGELFGSAIIITRQRVRGRPGLRNRDLVETFIYQAAVALQRRQAEEALQKAHDELERRVEERTAELKKANEQLKEEIEERKRAEEALHQSEQRYRSLVEAAMDVIFSISTHGTITSLNPAFEAITGWSRAEWIGKSFKPIIHPDDLPFAMELFQRILQGEKTPLYELRVLSKAGEYLTGQFSSTPQIQDGKVASILGIARDITERKRAEKALRQREAELEIKTRSLEEVNTALRVLLRKRDEDREELEEKLLSNVKELVLPFTEKVKQGLLDPKQAAYMDILESNLNDIISPFLRNLSARYVNLTPTEGRVAHLIKEGRTTKEIAELMALSPRTIETHRKNLRRKVGIEKNKGNLRSHLLSLQ